MIPDRPGIWLFRHNGQVHDANHEERIPIVYRRLEDGRVVLEPYGMTWPDMALEDFNGAGDWIARAAPLPADLAPLGDPAVLGPTYTELEDRDVLHHNYRLELRALPLREVMERAYLDNSRHDWERQLAREEHAHRVQVDGPFR
jgi:hypothetical protein